MEWCIASVGSRTLPSHGVRPRYALVGTKTGAIQVFSIASAEMVYEVPAHTGAVWSLAAQPGGFRLLSGSADKTIVVWRPVENGANSMTLGAALQKRHDRPASL